MNIALNIQHTTDPRIEATGDPLLANSVQEESVRLLGYDINYVDEGQGDVIVFLHNGGGFWQIWVNQIREFSKTNRVLALDWPGFGNSSGLAEPLTVDLTASVLEAFVEHFGLSDIILVGNCIGASTAIRYQNKHPEKIRGLVVMNICPGARMVKLGLMRRLLFGTREGRFKSEFQRFLKFVATRRLVARQFPGILFGGKLAKDDPLWVKYVAKFKEDRQNESRIHLLFAVNSFTLKDFIQNDDAISNSLLIWGRNNRVAPLKSPGYYHQQVCQIERIEIVPDTGHLTMYEAPARVNELIRQHMASL
jgi:pimeloyl-ACP methyl ester carboxylesterase